LQTKNRILVTVNPDFTTYRFSWMTQTTRPYHLYVLKPEGMGSLNIDGCEFVKYVKDFLRMKGREKHRESSVHNH